LSNDKEERSNRGGRREGEGREKGTYLLFEGPTITQEIIFPCGSVKFVQPVHVQHARSKLLVVTGLGKIRRREPREGRQARTREAERGRERSREKGQGRRRERTRDREEKGQGRPSQAGKAARRPFSRSTRTWKRTWPTLKKKGQSREMKKKGDEPAKFLETCKKKVQNFLKIVLVFKKLIPHEIPFGGT
jgi:hypothetical protein